MVSRLVLDVGFCILQRVVDARTRRKWISRHPQPSADRAVVPPNVDAFSTTRTSAPK
jgi:hypothetical protein